MSSVLGISTKLHLGLWRTNLCNSGWSHKQARQRAAALVTADAPWSAILLLGRRVSEAVGYDEPFFTSSLWFDGALRLLSIPHPSGRNRQWNDPTSVIRVRAMLVDALPDIPWGAEDEED